nr:transposase (putative), gypsy type [Tanacetum cinerariifolium]
MLIPFRGCLLVRERLRFRCLSILLSCSAAAYLSVPFPLYWLGPNLCILFIMGNITDIKSVLTQRALTIFCETYHIPDEVHPQLPSPNQTIHEMPSGKIGLYTRFFEYANFRLPLSTFFVNVLRYYHFHISQLSVIGVAKVSHFEVLCRVHGFEPTVGLFRCFYVNSKNKGWMSFSKRPGNNAVYYTKPLDSLKTGTIVSFGSTLLLVPPLFLGIPARKWICFLSFGPRKVRVAERQRVKNKLRLLESTVGRVVSLLLIAPASASSELEASVDKLFDEGASGDGQSADIQPVAATTDTIVEDVAPSQPRHQRKRKTDVADASGPSHPPKKLIEDYGALGGASTAGKSMSAVQSLFTGAVLNAEARGEPIPTLPFVTSSVSATSEREDKSEVDSIVRSSALTIATVTTVTASTDADATTNRAHVAPSLFGVGSSSTVYVPQWSATNGFGLDDSRIYREMLDEFAPPKFFASVRGMDHNQLFTEFNVGAARHISLNAKVRMRAEYNIREKMMLRTIVDEQAELLKAIRLRAEVFKYEAAEKSLRGEVEVREQEVADLDAQVTAVKLQNDNLVDQVHKLEISSVGLQEKVTAYEDFIGQLEKFQDKKMEEVNKKFDKLCADFVDMALHLEEKLYPHLLTTISGRRWLLTHGMELVVVKGLNSTKYLSAIGAVISKVVEKGMQEGISAEITYGVEGRKLADVTVHNPSAEADYLSALQRLHNRVVGAFALSLSLDVSHSRVKKMRENIAKHVSALRDVFVPLSEPLSAKALEGTKGTSGSTHDTTTTLSVTFVFASTIPPISTDDYEVAHADSQGVPVWMTRPQLLRTLAFFQMLATQS